MKEKVRTALEVCGIIAAGVIILKVLHLILWACYYAGIPM